MSNGNYQNQKRPETNALNTRPIDGGPNNQEVRQKIVVVDGDSMATEINEQAKAGWFYVGHCARAGDQVLIIFKK